MCVNSTNEYHKHMPSSKLFLLEVVQKSGRSTSKITTKTLVIIIINIWHIYVYLYINTTYVPPSLLDIPVHTHMMNSIYTLPLLIGCLLLCLTHLTSLLFHSVFVTTATFFQFLGYIKLLSTSKFLCMMIPYPRCSLHIHLSSLITARPSRTNLKLHSRFP